MYFKKTKRWLPILILGCTITLKAQIPQGYYDNAEGKTGEALKTALYNIIKGHVEFPYTASTTDVWDIIKESDRDTANAENVILLYSGLSVNAAQEYNNGNGWTREHVWAKVHGDFGTDPGPGTDLHHLRPENDEVNNARNSRWFAECSTAYYYNGTNTGCFTSNSLWVWKPRKEVIGDVARMMFYMATRYEGENGEPNLELVDYIPTNNNAKEPFHALLSDLLNWNLQDPVDNFERNRNEVIFSYQKNRNPFIDHPEYVQLIWGVNPAPVFTSEYDSTALTGEEYSYHITVIDNDPATLTFSLTEAPDWLWLTSNGNGTADLIGTPTAADIGDFYVDIEVKNNQGVAAHQQFYLRVTEGNGILITNSNKRLFYPNPAKHWIYFSDNQLNNIISIITFTGELISNVPANGTRLSIIDLSPGMYIVQSKNAGEIKSELLIVN